MTWGLGALAVDTAPLDWACPHCGRRSRARKPGNGLGRHWFLFGEPMCTTCAHHFHAAAEHEPEMLGHEEDR